MGAIKYIVAMMFVLLAVPAMAAQDETVVVEAEGMILLGDDSTIGQAKASALNNARRSALEKVTGVEVHGSSMVYNYQLINDLVITATKGIIVKESVIKSSCTVKDEQVSCSARILATVKPLHTERRGDFAVTKAVVHRYGSEASKMNPVFQSKDEVQIHAAVNSDAWLYLFNVDQNGNVTRLYPNEYAQANIITAGKELVFPEPAMREAGMKLKVATPKGVKKAVESVLVIATKGKKSLLEGNIENPTITDLMRELSEIDPSQWVEKTVGYEVRE